MSTDHRISSDYVFATQLRRHREARGWSQYDLADRSGLGRALVARLEAPGVTAESTDRDKKDKSGRGPRLSELLILAAVLGVPPAAMWVPLWVDTEPGGPGDIDGNALLDLDPRFEPLTVSEAALWSAGLLSPTAAAGSTPATRPGTVSRGEGLAILAFQRAVALDEELSRLVTMDRRYADDAAAGADYLRSKYGRQVSDLWHELRLIQSAGAASPPIHPTVKLAVSQKAAGFLRDDAEGVAQ